MEKMPVMKSQINEYEMSWVKIDICTYISIKGLFAARVVTQKNRRTINFRQTNFSKPFIELNTERRKNARNDSVWVKLMNNSVYGNTMEDVRKHGGFEIVNTPERFQKLVNKPLFKHRHIITEDLVNVEEDKHTLELSKPIYMGMSILDYSKIHMWSFYYDVFKLKYDNKINIVFIDTGSYVI